MLSSIWTNISSSPDLQYINDIVNVSDTGFIFTSVIPGAGGIGGFRFDKNISACAFVGSEV